ncbi:MAG: hypothetical protein HY706_16120 [Candidatus Hydrogenedentes bacterium]|nr:hypothetical protein [Candidatus Hydrogenedentota bacterium]
MPVVKKTYALPVATVERFEARVPPGKRSAVLAQLMHGWLEELRRSELARGIIEGCREMAEIYTDLEQDFHPLEEEAAYAMAPRSKSKTR